MKKLHHALAIVVLIGSVLAIRPHLIQASQPINRTNRPEMVSSAPIPPPRERDTAHYQGPPDDPKHKERAPQAANGEQAEATVQERKTLYESTVDRDVRDKPEPTVLKILVPADAPSPGPVLADYGAFRLVALKQSDLSRLTAQEQVGWKILTDADKILLRVGPLDTTKPPQDIPTPLRRSSANGQQLHLLQFIGPVQDRWLANVRRLGLEIVQYIPHNAYLVWGESADLDKLAGLPEIQWHGPYQPYYALHPALQALTEGDVQVTFQLYDHPHSQQTMAAIRNTALEIIKSESQVLAYRNVTVRFPASQLVNFAHRADVVNIEPWSAPDKLDEAQNQIMAGNLVITGTGELIPSNPGYLAWLNGFDFPPTPGAYPIVDVVDDGVGNGNAADAGGDATLRELGSGANPSRVAYMNNCTDEGLNGPDGHGHINASIVAGYNAQAGAPHVDANGYQRGQGVNPYGRVASTRIFDSVGYDLSACGNDRTLVENSYISGARISSNSWGETPGTGAYNSVTQTYDALTRDALNSTAGNQQMIFVFAAGNNGPAANTIGWPATGKNVIAVGAGENVRDDGVADGCAKTNADNADDLAPFSSRGPTDDGRFGLTVVAPGTHIQGTASTDPGFAGASVCGGPGNDGVPPPADAYYPAGQTTYTWSSGTSHSTPAAAGGASLLYYWLQNRYTLPNAQGSPNPANSGPPPSPALLKAFMANHARYMGGNGAGGNLPSSSQGLGEINLGLALDDSQRLINDQADVLAATGQVFDLTAEIVDNGRPFRVALAWTDAPGPTIGDAFVNDLDLEVTVGGNIYRGNVFSGANSVTGGSADPRNNLEAVFLPAGTNGLVIVRVIATNIAGHGVPGHSAPSAQALAVDVYNARPPNALFLTKSAAPSPVEPGQLLTYTLSAFNHTGQDLSGVVITDVLPANTQFVSASDDGSFDGNTVSWSSPSLLDDQTLTRTLTVRVGWQPNGSKISNDDYAIRSAQGATNTGSPLEVPVAWPNTDYGQLCSVELLSEPFETWPLIGWNIVDNAGSGCVWDGDNAAEGSPASNCSGPTGVTDPNCTGGSGNFADADSDACGPGTLMDTDLQTPLLDFSNLISPQLEFKSDMRWFFFGTDEQWDVDLSLDGGSSWPTNSLHHEDGDRRGPETITVDMPEAANQQNARVRFRYSNANFDWWWQVDDVMIRACDATLQPDVSITKVPSTSSGLVQVKQLLTYTLSITNQGTLTATTYVTDAIPANTTFAYADPPGIFTNNTVGWGFTDIPPNSTVDYVLAVTIGNVPTGTVITNGSYRASTTLGASAAGAAVNVTVGEPLIKAIYLPLLFKNVAAAPDLVSNFSTDPSDPTAGQPVTVNVTVSNVGNVNATAFWVDFYVDPKPVPTRANQIWNDLGSNVSPQQGIAWFVPGLAAGTSTSLTSQNLSVPHSVWSGSFVSGTKDLYVYADSFNPGVANGGVDESDETNNRSEILGLNVMGLNVTPTNLADPTTLPPR